MNFLDLQRQLRVMSDLRVAYDQSMVVLNETFKTLDRLNEAFAVESVELGQVCSDPLVFLESMVPLQPDKRITLPEFSFLCSSLGWQSPIAWDTEEEFRTFLESITYVSVVDKARSATPVPPSETPSASTVAAPVEASAMVVDSVASGAADSLPDGAEGSQ
jgi:hypothetical protein